MIALTRLSPFFALILFLGGCQAADITETSHLLDISGPIAIDVQSFGGDVIITGIDDASKASVHFKRIALHGKGREKDAARSLKQIATSAQILPGELGQVLEVRAISLHPEPHFQRVHIHIEAPLIDGVTVLTRHGKVYLRNVAGEIDIETTFGDVRVMTSQPMYRAVTIINRDGDIDYRIRGESRGAFDCEAVDGEVIHRVRFGVMRIFGATDHDTLKATLNQGDNPIRLRTTNGDIRIAVVSDPEAVGLRIFEP